MSVVSLCLLLKDMLMAALDSVIVTNYDFKQGICKFSLKNAYTDLCVMMFVGMYVFLFKRPGIQVTGGQCQLLVSSGFMIIGVYV